MSVGCVKVTLSQHARPVINISLVRFALFDFVWDCVVFIRAVID